MRNIMIANVGNNTSEFIVIPELLDIVDLPEQEQKNKPLRRPNPEFSESEDEEIVAITAQAHKKARPDPNRPAAPLPSRSDSNRTTSRDGEGNN